MLVKHTDPPQRVSKYNNIGMEIDGASKDIPFSVELTNIDKFVKRTNMSFNVYSYDENLVLYLVFIFYIAQNKKMINT